MGRKVTMVLKKSCTRARNKSSLAAGVNAGGPEVDRGASQTAAASITVVGV